MRCYLKNLLNWLQFVFILYSTCDGNWAEAVFGPEVEDVGNFHHLDPVFGACFRVLSRCGGAGLRCGRCRRCLEACGRV